MVKNQSKKSKNSDTSRPWGAFIALSLGAIIVSVVTWYGAHLYGKQLEEYYVTSDARNWSSLAIDNLNNHENSFVVGKLSRGDQYIIKDFYSGTNMYRVIFLNAKGEIFWSTRANEKGMYEKWRALEKSQKAGEIKTIFKQISRDKIVGLTFKTHSFLEKSYGFKLSNAHTVVEIARPVFKNKKFVGSIVMFTDVTGIAVWMQSQAKLVATFLIALTLLIFSAVALMIWSYSASRNKQSKELRSAKLESDQASIEAQEMAEQLQVMNSDIAKLNVNLKNNMKTLRATQDEVIRKGKMAQLGQLTATVAHDIRNPLGSIRTSTFLLRRKFSPENPKMEKPLDRIEKGVTRCDGIITELLEFARTKELDPKALNLDNWLVNLVRETAEQLPPEVSFECNLGLDDREILFDADSIARALINFLTNASEAMVGKGNEVPEKPTENPTISIATMLSDRGIEISVTDNGPGITEENMAKIRDPLFTTKSFGVGLGLPSVEKIFENHQGGMDIASTEGQGATFTGWFPLQIPPSTEVEAGSDEDLQKAG